MEKGNWRGSVYALAILAAFTLAGCSKIYFHNGPEPAKEIPPAKFHHNGIMGLVEFSKPVDLEILCQDRDWSVVMTENSFLTGLISTFTWIIYKPWTVSTSCK